MKENKSLGAKFSSLVKSFDFFGESIGFSVEGKSTYGSWIGAICSLAVVIVTLSYAT